jgi:aminoglycoside 3-N-acetyltransferase
MPTRQSIADDFVRIGLKPGDLLYLRVGLRQVGLRSVQVTDVFINGILDVLGADGTLIAPAFTETSYRWSRSLAVFNAETPPSTGAFSKLMLTQPGAVRSSHPTHSFVALGARAAEILADHCSKGASFEPIRKVVEADGLMALVGCLEDSPGFSTVHLAQFDLGLSQQHYVRFLRAVRRGSEQGAVFNPVESPGCSRNFGALYQFYQADGNFWSGRVGSADAISVRASAAYFRDREVLANDPRFTVCHDPACTSCRVLRGYNKRAIPAALWHRLTGALSGRGQY